jgi:hypothetical protein
MNNQITQIKKWWDTSHYRHLVEFVSEVIINSVVFFLIAGVAYTISLGLHKLYPDGNCSDFYYSVLKCSKQCLFIFDVLLFFILLILSAFRFLKNVVAEVLPSNSGAFIKSFFRPNPTKCSGVISVLDELPTGKIKSLFESANTQIDIIQTWLANESKILNLLFEAASRGCQVRILLLTNESSELAASRGKALSLSAQVVQEKINSSLTAIKETWESLGKPSNFEVRIYSTNPSIQMYRADNRFFFGPLLVGEHGVSSIALECDTETGFIQNQILNKHFEILWNDKSKPYLDSNDNM